jgi:glutathione S-transferase
LSGKDILMLELYHNDMSTCAQKVRLTLAEKGLEWKSHHLNLRAGDTRTDSYKKLNPKGVVPTLIDDGTVIIESTIIIEYLDDAYPEPPVKPADFKSRAQMRLWTKQLDEGLHTDIGTISGAVAFRYQTIEGRTAEELAAHMAKIPDPVRRERSTDTNTHGIESKFFAPAIRNYDKLLGQLEAALTAGPWLAGDTYSLADIAYTPYLTRFEHLMFIGMLDERPQLADWYERIKARPNYQIAIGDWLNKKYLPLMAEKGAEAWPRVQEILAAG